ncbi:MAG: glycosyltransferase 87 family protein [Polyangiaceae bacterium]
MLPAFTRRPRVAFVAAALVGCVWLNQGPSLRRYDALVQRARHGGSMALRAWLPFAFAYRRSADEELYFATTNAIRGAPFDRGLLIAKRGETSAAFTRFPASDGHWHMPYTEVPLEYPALVLPFILLPALATRTFGTFAMGFGALMAALLLAAIALVDRCGTDVDSERAARWWLAGALFLAQGGLLIQRLDAIPTLFLAVAFWAAVRRKPLWMGLGVGLAAAAKIAPLVVLFPMMAADRSAWKTPRALALLGGGLALGLGGGLLPMVLASPAGFANFIAYHVARGLHIESTYGAVLSVIALLRGHAEGATLSYGSFNVQGSAASFWAAASTPILAASLATLTAWLCFRPAPSTEAERVESLACASLAGILCVWLFGKVFSPQYMMWAIPFVLVISARRVALSLLCAMAISQIYLRGFYDQVADMRALGVFALAVRLAVLVALATYVIRAIPQGKSSGARFEGAP